MLLLLFLRFSGVVSGLDVEVTGVTCDKSLYVTAGFDVRCYDDGIDDGYTGNSDSDNSRRSRNGGSDGKKCTFGQSIATLTGFRKLCSFVVVRAYQCWVIHSIPRFDGCCS